MRAVGISLFAALIQQLRVALHPVYFNHNALYHVLQAIALDLVFLASRRLVEGEKEPGRGAGGKRAERGPGLATKPLQQTRESGTPG